MDTGTTMNIKTIEVTVSPAGETKIETKSFAGPGCLRASRFLEAAIGPAAAERLTAEFHADEPARRRLRE